MRTYWAIKWRSENRLDGRREHWVNDDCKPALFLTRKEAREYRAKRFGYILNRPDLKREPHGWEWPRVCKVRVDISEAA